ncbi:MAG TPA: ribose-phosphate pyrophosphokinase [Chloroflexota bacterium]|nr:ribose-phosphate pyrophosphokinase [Chloroflexota bacterium]
MYRDLSVFAGNAHPALAEEVCQFLELPLGSAEVFQFSNENIFVKINQVVREHDVFVIQPFCSPVNQSIMELLIMLDALKRASAGRITAVIPYFAYSRTDKKDQPRVPITARLLADMITVAGANRVLTLDLHAGQVQGFFNIPVDELTAVHLLRRYFRQRRLRDLVVVSADIGFAKKARNFAEMLDAPLAIIEKRRIGNAGVSESLSVIGDVRGRTALIVDDEVDRASSMTGAADALMAQGVREIYACAVHGVLSGPAVERINNSCITELAITDTIRQDPQKRSPKITQLSVAPLLGEAIRRIHTGTSVGSIYGE